MSAAPARPVARGRSALGTAGGVVAALVCIAVYAALVDPVAWLALVLLGVVALPAVALLLLLVWLARSPGLPDGLSGAAAVASVAASAAVAALGLWSLAVSIDGHDSGEVALSAAIAVVLCAPLATLLGSRP